ncbi:TATA-box-binding protein [halophilic archaeon]|nr:TATA-box-binding protein [halophilic archaeon]
MNSISKFIQVENVVASSNIGQELDLESLAEDLESVDYDPDNFPGLIYRIQDPQATILIFRSGKVVCTGAKSVDNVKAAIKHVFVKLRDLGISISTSTDIVVQNIVSSADLNATLNLNTIAVGLGFENVEYEPEQFPGIVYRLTDLDVVVLLFGSGKLIITGGNELEDADQALTLIKNRLTELGLLE